MVTRIHIAEGVSLQIDNETSELSPKQIKTLSEQLIKLIENNNG
ncbi:hypothetical protein JCM19241_3100 [Vibrio ishigakensis]|uniref:Uncharacterized protein n=1 Tax=Vibrio ishigakensis TaxID=1481914 RepID=A0A0B8Q294_9VIBR|nr:hypothetical protein JCM19241_3100 [Vibrio ishigakensis]